MQTLANLEVLLANLTLPNGWRVVYQVPDEEEFAWLQVWDPKGIDNVTGEAYPWRGRKWKLSRHMTNSEVVQTAFMATMAAVEHETREQFLYKGQPIFDPHYDIEQLHLLRMTAALDKRAS